jgi:cell wall assembly regulator SMI1
MEAVWARIEAWFRWHAPDVLDEFRPPALNRHINHLENTTGVRLPADLERSYKVHDGSWCLRMFPRGNLLGVQGVEEEWLKWREVLESGDLTDMSAAPEGPIKPVHWNTRWLPLTTNGGGSHYCADLDPAPGGSVGQIIWFHRTDGPVIVIASGFAEWLGRYAADLEAGRYVFVPPCEVAESEPR